jgi:hypothetical protein
LEIEFTLRKPIVNQPPLEISPLSQRSQVRSNPGRRIPPKYPKYPDKFYGVVFHGSRSCGGDVNYLVIY